MKGKKEIKLTNYERETVINYNAQDKKAIICTAIPTDKNKLAKLAKECPNNYKLLKQDDAYVWYEADKKLCVLRKPKELTEEQKQILVKRLTEAKKLKLKDNKKL